MTDDGDLQKRPTTQFAKPQAVAPQFVDTDILGPAYYGDLAKMQNWIAKGYDVNYADPATGLTALHLAVGTNNLAMTKALVEEHEATFAADRFGRWPSVMAIDCKVSDELSDYIVHAEAKFLGLDD